jgi:hypothetical protein
MLVFSSAPAAAAPRRFAKRTLLASSISLCLLLPACAFAQEASQTPATLDTRRSDSAPCPPSRPNRR